MSRWNRKQAVCVHGHRFTSKNTYINPKYPNSRQCRACQTLAKQKWNREHPGYWKQHQKKRHGLSEERYDKILKTQNGLCAICKRPFLLGELPYIDHDHACCPTAYSCGQCVRGIVHAHCNWGIGHLQDDPTICRLAAEYLEKYRAKHTAKSY